MVDDVWGSWCDNYGDEGNRIFIVISIQIHGTVIYMAPEALYEPSMDGSKRPTRLVDLWSLGMILYQMLHRGMLAWDSIKNMGNLKLAMAIADPRHKVPYYQEETVDR